MYDHSKQYRCIIIRGKAQNKLDDLLPAYALVLDDICPCVKEEFELKFNAALASLLRTKSSDAVAMKKTLDNHRTEIAGKLFGMYYLSRDGIVYASERTKKYLADNDQPAFFKDMCFKLQFPNGMNKIQTVEPYLNEHISIRQYPFIIKCLFMAEERKIRLTVSDIGYYMLNSLDVLTGRASCEEVLLQIALDKAKGIIRKIVVPGKATSYTMQHIKEQINYLELANLIYVNDDKEVLLNHREEKCLALFLEQCGKSPDFDMYSYDISSQEGRDDLYYDWDLYYSKVSIISSSFATDVSALVPIDAGTSTSGKKPTHSEGNMVELGDEGESYVYEYEKKRVAAFNPRLVNKVLPLGKTKGLGFDIQSVIAEVGDMAEFVKYIEVKSTKRVTAPDINDAEWIDTVNITRNEYIAAMQHRGFYSIYRVYFVRDGVVIYVINDVYKKSTDGTIQIVPTLYRLDFSKSAIDAIC